MTVRTKQQLLDYADNNLADNSSGDIRAVHVRTMDKDTVDSIYQYVDDSVVGAFTDKGNYNASTNTPDLDTAPSGIESGDVYVVNVAGNFYTESVEIGDVLRALQDNPTQLSHWAITQANLDAPSVKALYESNADTNAYDDASKAKVDAIDQVYTSAEKTKLSGIEDNAEVNQSDSEIKTQYENNSDTNAFTDADKTKLDSLSDNYKGHYLDETALTTAHPSPSAGSYATVESTDTVWAWDNDGSSWVNTGGTGVATDLSTTYTPTSVVVNSSSGDNAQILPAVASGNAGMLTGADKAKIDNGTNLGTSYTPTSATITNDNGTTAQILPAVASGNSGMMTGADKAKLDGVTGDGTTDLSTSYTTTSATIQSSNGNDAQILPAVASGNAGMLTGADKQKIDDGTNLTMSRTATSVTIQSSDGTNAQIFSANAGTPNTAGVMTSAEQTKLTGIATGATVNDTDANLKNRANHTGTQTASTISDFDTEVSNNTTVAEKVSSNTSGVTGADQVTNMMSLTQAEYDAIGTKNASTLYVIVG